MESNLNIFLPKYEKFCTKLIFYRIPKNASTSVYEHLGYLNIIKQNESLITENTDQRLYKKWFSPTHLKPSELESIIGEGIKNYFSFCIVRNPWDRAVSMYKFAIKHKLYKLYGLKENCSFLDFCKILKKHKNDPFFIASHQQTQWVNCKHGPKTIIRFENIEEEYYKMLEDLNIDFKYSLEKLNTTKHKHYSFYYTKRAKQIIQNVFIEDIKQFGYFFEKKFEYKKEQKRKEGFLRF